tara:strand:- start:395 stop:1345 length:951 start_codon:yes stop_codon:yes gene_type:complete
MDFIITFSNIWADILGITKRYPISKRHKYIEFVKTLTIPTEAVCRDIDNDDNKMNNNTETYVNMITSMIETNKDRLSNVSIMEFEKDDDKNHHIDFITTAANLRATNYSIKTQDKLSVKGIAGKIIPAIATTTSIVSGLVALEFYKLCYGQEIKDYNTLQRYRYGSFNLAVQTFCFGESRHAKTTLIGNNKYSIWSKEEIKHDMNFKEFIDSFNLENNNNGIYELEVDFVANETGILYSNMLEGLSSDIEIDYKSEAYIMNKTVGDVIKESLKIDRLDGDYFLTVCLEKVIDSDLSDNEEFDENDENISITCRISV